MLKNFSRNIILLRSHYGYSQKHMAQLLGIGVESLRKIEKGIIPPRLTVDVIFPNCLEIGCVEHPSSFAIVLMLIAE